MDFFNNAIECLPKFCDYIEPTAKRSGITPRAAFFLFVLSEYPYYIDFYFFNDNVTVDELIKKGCILNEGGRFSFTSKGAIVTKSIITAKQKFELQNN